MAMRERLDASEASVENQWEQMRVESRLINIITYNLETQFEFNCVIGYN